MGGQTGGDQRASSAALIAEILELADSLRACLDAPCVEQGVSASRYRVLTTIDCSGQDGCSQTELAAQLGLSESNVSTLVEGLRKTGLLYRFRSKADRRRSVLLLTDDGKSLVLALTKARDVAAGSLLSSLTPQQISDLRTLLSTLGSRLGSGDKAVETARGNVHRTEFRRAS
jgi:DNA-binding MarR family transcriptional regulator